MDLTSLLFPLLILLLFIPIFLSGRRQRRQMQEMQALQAALEPGDVVMTTSGLRGTVVDASYEETVDLEIADGVVTTWVRAAVKSKTDVEPAAPAEVETSEPASGATPARADVTDSPRPEPVRAESSTLSLEKDDSANGTPRS
jgi:preprotein translocase subunit YajC